MSDPTSATQGWEQRIETALDPGRYVSKRACFGFVNDLEQVAGDLTGLVATDPASAVTVYETFVAGCTEKADEVDDSSGEFGSFVVSLVSGLGDRTPGGGRPPGPDRLSATGVDGSRPGRASASPAAGDRSGRGRAARRSTGRTALPGSEDPGPRPTEGGTTGAITAPVTAPTARQGQHQAQT